MTTGICYTNERIKPNEHQKFGAFSISKQKRVLLGDHAGYGKTIQAIYGKMYIERSLGRPIKALVVCPNSAKSNWAGEILANYDQKVKVLDGYDEASLSSAADADFVVVNYDIFGNKKRRKEVTNAIKSIGFEYVVFDEGHNLSDTSKCRTPNLRKIAKDAPYFAYLSATPIPDNLADAYYLIHMLDPKNYPTPESVAKMHRKSPWLIRSAEPMVTMFRRGNDQMPEICNHPVVMSPEQEAVYTSVLEQDDISPTVKLDQLRKAALDPSLVDPRYIADEGLRAHLLQMESSKYLEVDRILEPIIASGEKAVIFTSRFKEGVTKKLKQRYEKYGAVMIDGSVTAGYRGSSNKREELRQRFQSDDNCKVLIMNDTVSEAISLTAASNLIFLDRPYSPHREYQVIKRLDRRGQTRKVNVVNLVAQYPLHELGSIDEGIGELLEEKKRIIDIVLKGKELKEEEHELVSETPITSQHPLEQRMYTPRQYLRRITSRMVGQGSDTNRAFLDRNDGRMARVFAESYDDNWEASYSAKTAQIYKQIIESLKEAGEDFGMIADLASGPAVLSRVLGEPVVNLDFNKYHFEKARDRGADIGNSYVEGVLSALPFMDESFGLDAHSLALHWLPDKKRKKDTEKKKWEVVREREMAIREAARTIKKNGYYIIALPQYIRFDADEFYAGLKGLGLSVIPELTGRVKGIEPADTNYEVTLITAKKVGSPEGTLSDGCFRFNIDKSRESKRGSRKVSIEQPPENNDIVTRFAFYDPQTGLEDVGERVSRYLSSDLSGEVRRKVSTLPTAILEGEEYVVRQEGRRGRKNSVCETFVPPERVTSLLERVNGRNKSKLKEEDYETYEDLKRLRLLHLIPAK